MLFILPSKAENLGRFASRPNWLPESRSGTPWRCYKVSFLQEYSSWNWDESQPCHSEMYELGCVPSSVWVSVISPIIWSSWVELALALKSWQGNLHLKSRRMFSRKQQWGWKHGLPGCTASKDGVEIPRLSASQKSGGQSLWKWVPKWHRFPKQHIPCLKGTWKSNWWWY